MDVKVTYFSVIFFVLSEHYMYMTIVSAICEFPGMPRSCKTHFMATSQSSQKCSAFHQTFSLVNIHHLPDRT